MNSNILIILVFLPLAAGFISLFLPNRLRILTTAAALVISLVAFFASVRLFRSGQAVSLIWPVLEMEAVDFDLTLLLRARPLGTFILMFAMGFGVLIVLYSLKSVGDKLKRPNEYYGSIMLAIGGSAGVLLCDHLLFLLIFWEIVTVSLYLLIATGGRKSNFAATKSFAMIGASDGAFLLGIAMVWAVSKSFVISDIAIATDSAVPIVAFLLLMLAAITKAGAMPLHTWLPTSGEYAPAPVMALLPAALDKLLGIYLLVIIVLSLFELQSGALSVVLAVIGAATIIVAVMVAMVQHNLKRLLSYHAISQVGYMVLGIATLTPVGIAGGIFHMLNHAIYKCCLFLCGGAVEQQTGTAELDRLGGLGGKMPLTFTACMIAALSISGVPPLNGFVSKWMVYQGVIEMGSQSGSGAGLWPLWLTCAMFGSALTLASFVKILHSVFLSRLPDDLQYVKEVSALQYVPMLVLAALCVLFGVFYHVPLQKMIYPALGISPNANVIFGQWQSVLATGLIVIGAVIGLTVVIIGLAARKIRIVSTWTCGEIQENDRMIIPGTDFYRTVSAMRPLKQLYAQQEKGRFDMYDGGGKAGLGLTGLLKWLHSGVLPTYLTWVTLGLLIVLFAICRIW